MKMFPEHWNSDQIIRFALAEILINQEKQMAAIDDLNAAVTQLSTDVAALIAKPEGTSDAQIEAVVTSVNALDAQVKAALPTQP